MTVAERIARQVLESNAGTYYVANHEDHRQRQRAVEAAAQQIQPMLDELVHQALEAVATNPS